MSTLDHLTRGRIGWNVVTSSNQSTAKNFGMEHLPQHDDRYDIADETQHVRFGKRWLPELIKHVGEKRSLEKYTADVIDVWQREYRTGKLTINVE